MLPRYRKIFLIIALIIATLIIGFLLFYFFFHTQTTVQPPSTQPTGDNQTPTNLPPTGEGKLPTPSTINKTPGNEKTPEEDNNQISDIAQGGVTLSSTIYDKPTYGSTIAPDGKDIISYDRVTGKFVRISPEGKVSYMSDKVFYSVEKITWSSNKTEAILEYPDGANIVYNFKTQKQITLPKQWEDFSFSPLNDQIVAKNLDANPENSWLVISDSRGTNIKPVERLGENGDKVHNNWSPDDKIVAMYEESKDFDRQNLYFIGQNQENFPLTIIEGRGFEGQWTKTGDKLLYSVYNSTSNFNPVLWTVTAQGENMSQFRKKLNISTWASKCSFFDNENIYCAVPESLPEGSGIFPDVADDIPDNIYKINITTGAKKFIARPSDNATVENIFISEDETSLYYTDKATGLLKKINLK